jgi:UDP-N-acetylmuramyl pentapeptide phosphotransferase/UDP-N-acetylglucosamine-1-phosphate transferase
LLALARRRRLTTGLLKAVLGAAAGIFVARLFSSDSWSLAFAEGVAIALCANAVNLLDVRPGRAGACFLAGGYAMTLVHLARGDAAGLLPLMAVWLPAALVQRGDAQAKAMLGDAGSNLLGAALGLELVLAAQSPGSLAALVALLAALHLVSERASLTSLIERSRLLRRLDSLTGLRGRPP